jgi:hypothetical protein
LLVSYNGILFTSSYSVFLIPGANWIQGVDNRYNGFSRGETRRDRGNAMNKKSPHYNLVKSNHEPFISLKTVTWHNYQPQPKTDNNKISAHKNREKWSALISRGKRAPYNTSIIHMVDHTSKTV